MKMLAFAALLTLSACGQPQKAGVDDVVVHLPVAEGRPGVAYFTVKGGAVDAQLVSASSPQVIRVELHDNVMENGVMKMVRLEGGAAIPAGSTVKFEPGGKHAMLFDINPSVKNGSTIPLTFTYADGSKIEATGSVKPRSEAAGHDH